MKVVFINLALMVISLLITTSPKQPAIQDKEPATKTDQSQNTEQKKSRNAGINESIGGSAGQINSDDEQTKQKTQSDDKVYTVNIVSQPSNPTDKWIIASVVVSGLIAFITGISLWFSRYQLRLDQRAWIGVQTIQGDLVAEKPYEIVVVLINVGKTPAVNISSQHSFNPVKKGDKITFEHEKVDTKPTRGILIPHSTHLIRLKHKDPATKDHVDTVATEAVLYTVFGTVTYQDIFKRKHWLTFYYFLRPDGMGYYIGQEHNETGDDDPPKNC